MSNLEYVLERTISATDFECQIINAVLGTNLNKEELRFEQGHACSNCSRTLSILDVVLTGIVFHGIRFIRTDIATDEQTVLVADHGFDIHCINCGTINSNGYKLYAVGPNHLAMSSEDYANFHGNFSQSADS